MQATTTRHINIIKEGHISTCPLSDIKPGFTESQTPLDLRSREKRLDLYRDEALPKPPKVLDFSSPELAFKDMGLAGYGLVIIDDIPAGTAVLYTGTGSSEIITTEEAMTIDTDEIYGMIWRPNFPGKFVVHINAEHQGDLGGFIQHIPSEEEYKTQYILTEKAETERALINLDLRLVDFNGQIYLAFVLREDCHGTPDNPIMLGYSYGPKYWSKCIPQLLSKSGEPLERSTYTYIPPLMRDEDDGTFYEFSFINNPPKVYKLSPSISIANLYGFALANNQARLIDPELNIIHDKINDLFKSAGFIPTPFGCDFLSNGLTITYQKKSIITINSTDPAFSTPKDSDKSSYLAVSEPGFPWGIVRRKIIKQFFSTIQGMLLKKLETAMEKGTYEKIALEAHSHQLIEQLYKFAITSLFRVGQVKRSKYLLEAYCNSNKEQQLQPRTATVFDAEPTILSGSGGTVSALP